MTDAIYNENDRYGVQWLRNLIAAGHIAHGVVDDRSVSDLVTADVAGLGQRHFFAGIGVWSAALRDAGWSDDRPVWTGSCPCQPFSDAGRGRGTADERHLWPEWFRLIRECRPPAIFGEQVASRAGLGWLDAVFADLEGEGYTCAAADLPAAGIGAPHKRSRLFFVAYASSNVRHEGNALGPGRGSRAEQDDGRDRSSDDREAGQLVNSDGARGGRDPRTVAGSEASSSDAWRDHRRLVDVPESAGATRGFWSSADWLLCRDGKARPVEPGTFPLVDGTTRGVVRNRAGKLKGYGNAIVRQAAAAFIRSVIGAHP